VRPPGRIGDRRLRPPQGHVYPLDEMAKIFEPKPLRARTDLGHGATADVHGEQARMPDGRPSNRIMVGIKLPF